MLSNKLCPVCNIHALGSQSLSTRPKSSFKTCGSKTCLVKLRSSNRPSGYNFSRNIEEYNGERLCDYGCNFIARYLFSNNKFCCSRIASNCGNRKLLNRSIAEKLKNDIDKQTGKSKTKLKADKAVITKVNDVDELGNNGFDRFSIKLKQTIENSRDENGRTYQSRSKLTDEEFFLKPEKEIYYIRVWEITDKQFYLHFYDITNAHLRSTEYHLDHIFSVSEGFKHNIPPEIVAHHTNLRIIPQSENCSKQDKCDKTITQLYEDYFTKGV